jgi:TPR repeat protein
VAWKEKLEDKGVVNELQMKADQGDASARCALGPCYVVDRVGITEDQVQTHAWMKHVPELDNLTGMAAFGLFLLNDTSGPSISSLGVFYTSQKAWLGSEQAVFDIGMAFMKGLYDLPQDSVQTKRHLRQVLKEKCDHEELNQEGRDQAKQFLLKLG